VTAPAAGIDSRPWAVGLRELLREVAAERRSQFQKWGGQRHPDVDCFIAGLPAPQARRYAAQFYGVPTADAAKAETDAAARAGQCSWAHIAVEELCELLDAAAVGDLPAARAEALQLAAVCVQWVQDLDRRTGAVR
jgi:hypothetical protein